MPYQPIGDFPVNFMMNQFDLSDWYNNDERHINPGWAGHPDGFLQVKSVRSYIKQTSASGS